MPRTDKNTISIVFLTLIIISFLVLPTKSSADDLSLAKELYSNGFYPEALDKFLSLRYSSPPPENIEEVEYYIATCLFLVGRDSEAKRMVEKALQTASTTHWKRELQLLMKLLSEVKPKVIPTSLETILPYRIAQDYENNGEEAAAAEWFKRAYKKGLEKGDTEVAYAAEIRRCRILKREWELAYGHQNLRNEEFNIYWNSHTEPEAIVDAYRLLQVQTAQAQQKQTAALAAYGELITDASQNYYGSQALLEFAEFCFQVGLYQKAKAAFERLIKQKQDWVLSEQVYRAKKGLQSVKRKLQQQIK